jgi:hypothetical protein
MQPSNRIKVCSKCKNFIDTKVFYTKITVEYKEGCKAFRHKYIFDCKQCLALGLLELSSVLVK